MSRFLLVVGVVALGAGGCGRTPGFESVEEAAPSERASSPPVEPPTASAITAPAPVTNAVAACIPGKTQAMPQPTCADLAGLALASPVLVDDGEDGVLSPGEGALLEVQLQDKSGTGFGSYPGVLFESATPGVSAKETDWLYALLPCQSTKMKARVQVDGAVPKGTTAFFTARAAMLHQTCPQAPSLTVVVPVR